MRVWLYARLSNDDDPAQNSLQNQQEICRTFAEEAEHYRALFPDAEVIGFDYRAQTPWEAKEEFPAFFRAQKARCELAF